MATITKRMHKDGSAAYEIRVSLGRDIHGKQILKYRVWHPGPGMTQRQIEKALEREKVLFEEQCRAGRILDTSTKFADFATGWLERHRNIHAPAYRKRAEDLLVRINAAIGHIPIGKLKPHHLQEFYANLAEEGVKKIPLTASSIQLAGLLAEREIPRRALAATAQLSSTTITKACRGQNIRLDCAERIATALACDPRQLFQIRECGKQSLSVKTILHHHRLISSILESAVKWQAIFDNPARRVDLPKQPRREAAYLDDQQILQVVEALAAEPLKWRTLLMLLIYSGMRRGEACGLTWPDLDFEKQLVHITKANQYLAGQGIFEKDTKNLSSNRVIKLPAEMFDLLRQYRAWQNRERLLAGDRWQDSGKLFTGNDGRPLHPDSVAAWVKKFREAHSLPYFTPHSLRHTSATLLIMQGVPIKAVSARLGHANQHTTNTIYSHAIQTVDALASDVIGDLLQPQAGTVLHRKSKPL